MIKAAELWYLASQWFPQLGHLYAEALREGDLQSALAVLEPYLRLQRQADRFLNLRRQLPAG